MTMVFGTASAAFAFTEFPVTPNFDGVTKQAGSTLTLNWTSGAGSEPLEVWQTIYTPNPDGTVTQSSTQVGSGLPADGSYSVTIPDAAIGKKVGYRIQTASWSWYGSSTLWEINVVPAAAPPVVSTPASSPWSLALAAAAALGLAAVPAVRRRLTGPKS
jgi:hypothetical protein